MYFQAYNAHLPIEWFARLTEIAAAHKLSVTALVRGQCQAHAGAINIDIAVARSGGKRTEYVRSVLLESYPELAAIPLGKRAPRGRPSVMGQPKGPMRVTLSKRNSRIWRDFALSIGHGCPEELVRQCLDEAAGLYMQQKKLALTRKTEPVHDDWTHTKPTPLQFTAADLDM